MGPLRQQPDPGGQGRGDRPRGPGSCGRPGLKAAAGKSAAELELYARNLARSADRASAAEQLGFAGLAQDFADFEREAAAVAKIQAQRIQQKKDLVLAAEVAARRPEAARKMGLPVNDSAALQARVAQLRAELRADVMDKPTDGGRAVL